MTGSTSHSWNPYLHTAIAQTLKCHRACLCWPIAHLPHTGKYSETHICLLLPLTPAAGPVVVHTWHVCHTQVSKTHSSKRLQVRYVWPYISDLLHPYCVRSLVCMVGVIYLYIDTVFGFYVLYGFCIFFNCLAGCFSMIVWRPTVLSVWYACFIFLYLSLFSAIEHVSHGKAL